MMTRHSFTAALPLASYRKSHPRKHFQSQTFTRALLGIYQKGVLQYLSPILQRHSFRPLTSGTEGWNGGGRVQQLKVLIPPEWKESRSRKENPICQENHHPSLAMSPSWNCLECASCRKNCHVKHARIEFLQETFFRPPASGTGGWGTGEGLQQLKVLIPPEWKESRSRKENPVCQENPHRSPSRCPLMEFSGMCVVPKESPREICPN
ncbi:hypothetical protein CDAR_445861 [Caerostris darwini]|uniref:Uncharacterized protein n=1 Tax=Caerostris darwini TaxID=1538125 RepID=A0AAV4U0J2_9ARAC|nr:hypothetical protein CDAR_445861 [Caerostris darwini]